MHHHSHHDHDHGATGHLLTGSLILTLGFAGVEAVAGWWAGSLALMGDAGHMVTDATALGLAALAAWVAKRPPSPRHSYGLGRAESLAALVNGVFMLTVVTGIVVSAIERLQNPMPVTGSVVLGVAALGLAINIAVILLLSRGEQDLNTRGALLHVVGDMLGSMAALIAGAVIHFTGWTPIDPILSLFICALILYSSVRLLHEVLHVILEGVPRHLDLPEVGRTMAAVDGVRSVHDLHIWTLSSGMVALSAHLVIEEIPAWERILGEQRRLLHERFGIEHVTLQPEPEARPIEIIRPE